MEPGYTVTYEELIVQDGSCPPPEGVGLCEVAVCLSMTENDGLEGKPFVLGTWVGDLEMPAQTDDGFDPFNPCMIKGKSLYLSQVHGVVPGIPTTLQVLKGHLRRVGGAPFFNWSAALTVENDEDSAGLVVSDWLCQLAKRVVGSPPDVVLPLRVSGDQVVWEPTPYWGMGSLFDRCRTCGVSVDWLVSLPNNSPSLFFQRLIKHRDRAVLERVRGLSGRMQSGLRNSLRG